MNDDGPDVEPGRATPGSNRIGDSAWLWEVTDAAAADAGAPAELLGEYPLLLMNAAISGGRPDPDDLALVRGCGARAPHQGVAPGRAVNLYLSAAWRLWRELRVVMRSSDAEVVGAAADAVLQAVGDAVAVFVDGYQDERRES